MAAVTSPRALPHHALTPRTALAMAWRIWSVLLLIPFFFALATVALVGMSSGALNPILGQYWFFAALVWIGAGIPMCFFIRARLFKAWWEGGVVDPRHYLMGMVTVWMAIELAGLFAIAGMFFSGQLLPALIPAMVAFVLFLPMYPTGLAMTEPVGAEDDSAIFQHPR